MTETSPYSNERERLMALRQLELLDSPPEERFDRLTAIARALFDVPIALITLVDEDRQWFKSSIGTDEIETPRSVSFCAHAVAADMMLVVEDATRDPRFLDNPLVTGDMHLRFYAGHPIHSPDGHAVGAICIIDQHPRRFNENHRLLLKQLAEMVDKEIREQPPKNLDGPTEDEQFGRILQRIGSFISRRSVALVISALVFSIIMLVLSLIHI